MNKSHFPLFTFHLPDVEALRFGSMLTLFNNPYVKLINATLFGKNGRKEKGRVKKSKSRKAEKWKSGKVEVSKSQKVEEEKSGKLKVES